VAWAQEAQEIEAQEISEQAITVPPHWSPYQAPTSYPEGTQLHIIVKGDTLWDLASQYLTNPFLWPQLWDANRYITNPHWIYPGDPLVIPEVDVVREPGEEPGAPGAPGAPGEEPGGVPGEPGAPLGPFGRPIPSLLPAYEEVSIQCAGYVADKEDERLKVIGSEEGPGGKIALATGDIVYINGGTDDGVSPGDMYYVQRRTKKVSGGWNILRTGWVTVLATQERSAIAEITQACIDVHMEDYLLPFEQIPVPLIPTRREVATRLTPETGKIRGEIVASIEEVLTLGQGNLVGLNVGEQDGVIPGNIFTIFRYLYKGVQRKMLGELVILTVREKTSTAKIINSYDYIVEGDLVELK
jgi:hypothetical protein